MTVVFGAVLSGVTLGASDLAGVTFGDSVGVFGSVCSAFGAGFV